MQGVTRIASKLLASRNAQFRVRSKNQVVSIFARNVFRLRCVVMKGAHIKLSIATEVCGLIVSQKTQISARSKNQVESIFARRSAGAVTATWKNTKCRMECRQSLPSYSRVGMVNFACVPKIRLSQFSKKWFQISL